MVTLKSSRSSFPLKDGLPMGSSISGILAILFMAKLENVALSSNLLINPYKSYVDDIYLRTTNEATADQFYQTMNNLDPKLKFEIEKPEVIPNGLSLAVVTLHTFALGKLDLLTVSLKKLNFSSVTDFP